MSFFLSGCFQDFLIVFDFHEVYNDTPWFVCFVSFSVALFSLYLGFVILFEPAVWCLATILKIFLSASLQKWQQSPTLLLRFQCTYKRHFFLPCPTCLLWWFLDFFLFTCFCLSCFLYICFSVLQYGYFLLSYLPVHQSSI